MSSEKCSAITSGRNGKVMWLFRPEHTPLSVARELVEGLESGRLTVVDPAVEPPDPRVYELARSVRKLAFEIAGLAGPQAAGEIVGEIAHELLDGRSGESRLAQ